MLALWLMTANGSKAVNLGSSVCFPLCLRASQKTTTPCTKLEASGSARAAMRRTVVSFRRQKIGRFTQPFADSVNIERDTSASEVAGYFGGLVASIGSRVVGISSDGHSDYQLKQAVARTRSYVPFELAGLGSSCSREAMLASSATNLASFAFAISSHWECSLCS